MVGTGTPVTKHGLGTATIPEEPPAWWAGSLESRWIIATFHDPANGCISVVDADGVQEEEGWMSDRGPARILHLIDTGGPGGAEMVLATIVSSLPASRWQSRVIVPRADWLLERLSERGHEVVSIPTHRSADVGYLARLVREVRAFRPTVIHAHLLGSAVYGSLAALLSGGTPVLCTFHGRPDLPSQDRLLSLKGRILSRSANRIAYVSHDLRAFAEPLLGVPARAGAVVHNGVDFTDPPISGDERLECGARPGHVLIGAVGNIRPAKDYANLLRAAAVVCASRPEVRFAIAGDRTGPLAEPLRRMVEQLGLEDRVRFLGFRSDVRALIKSFDLFVSSSYTEGLPLATVEAVGMGVPVVVTNCGGVPEVVTAGETGLLVPPRDAAALAEGILSALGNWERSTAMARAGALDVRRRFAKERMCGAYQALYAEMIAASG